MACDARLTAASTMQFAEDGEGTADRLAKGAAIPESFPDDSDVDRRIMLPSIAMFVLNPVKFDRRVIREAESLAASGCEVTVFGTAEPGVTAVSRERHLGGFDIVRVPFPERSMLWNSRRADFTEGWRGFRQGPWTGIRAAQVTSHLPWWMVKTVVAGGSYLLHVTSRGHATWMVNGRSRWWAWGRAVLAEVGPADVYHGHDLPGLGLAVAARRRHGGRLVYDSHDLFVEAGANATRPAPVRRLIRILERRWYRQADLLITVNEALAEQLNRRYGSKQTAVVHNCVPRWDPSKVVGDPLRTRAGIPAATPVVLYHGGFTANRGLGHLMRSFLEPGLEVCHLILLGYGPMQDELQRLASSDRYSGRIHVLAAVAPEDLDANVACADVAAMVNQPSSLNELLSTPNKLFESIAAGIPIVTSDFPMRRQIVLDDPRGPLGAVCDPTDPKSIAAAIRQLLEASASDREQMRERCLQAAREQWNWEREAASLVSAYRALLETSPALRAPRRLERLH